MPQTLRSRRLDPLEGAEPSAEPKTRAQKRLRQDETAPPSSRTRHAPKPSAAARREMQKRARRNDHEPSPIVKPAPVKTIRARNVKKNGDRLKEVPLEALEPENEGESDSEPSRKRVRFAEEPPPKRPRNSTKESIRLKRFEKFRDEPDAVEQRGGFPNRAESPTDPSLPTEVEPSKDGPKKSDGDPETEVEPSEPNEPPGTVDVLAFLEPEPFKIRTPAHEQAHVENVLRAQKNAQALNTRTSTRSASGKIAMLTEEDEWLMKRQLKDEDFEEDFQAKAHMFRDNKEHYEKLRKMHLHLHMNQLNKKQVRSLESKYNYCDGLEEFLKETMRIPVPTAVITEYFRSKEGVPSQPETTVESADVPPEVSPDESVIVTGSTRESLKVRLTLPEHVQQIVAPRASPTSSDKNPNNMPEEEPAEAPPYPVESSENLKPAVYGPEFVQGPLVLEDVHGASQEKENMHEGSPIAARRLKEIHPSTTEQIRKRLARQIDNSLTKLDMVAARLWGDNSMNGAPNAAQQLPRMAARRRSNGVLLKPQFYYPVEVVRECGRDCSAEQDPPSGSSAVANKSSEELPEATEQRLESGFGSSAVTMRPETPEATILQEQQPETSVTTAPSSGCNPSAVTMRPQAPEATNLQEQQPETTVICSTAPPSGFGSSAVTTRPSEEPRKATEQQPESGFGSSAVTIRLQAPEPTRLQKHLPETTVTTALPPGFGSSAVTMRSQAPGSTCLQEQHSETTVTTRPSEEPPEATEQQPESGFGSSAVTIRPQAPGSTSLQEQYSETTVTCSTAPSSGFDSSAVTKRPSEEPPEATEQQPESGFGSFAVTMRSQAPESTKLQKQPPETTVTCSTAVTMRPQAPGSTSLQEQPPKTPVTCSTARAPGCGSSAVTVRPQDSEATSLQKHPPENKLIFSYAPPPRCETTTPSFPPIPLEIPTPRPLDQQYTALSKEVLQKRLQLDAALKIHFDSWSRDYFAGANFKLLIDSTPEWFAIPKFEQVFYLEQFDRDPDSSTIPHQIWRFLHGKKRADHELRRVFLNSKMKRLAGEELQLLGEKYQGDDIEKFVEDTMELTISTPVIREYFRRQKNACE